MARSTAAARLAKWGSVPAGLTVSALLIWQASYAAFSDTTDNPGNNWEAGSVAISDDDEGSALFAAAGLTPGATGERCITTTYIGSLAAEVRLYGSDAASTDELDEHINLTITSGTGGSYNSCEDFVADDDSEVFSGSLADFAANHTDYASGIDLGTVVNESAPATYQFSYTFAADAPNTVQKATADLGFVWEAQSTPAN